MKPSIKQRECPADFDATAWQGWSALAQRVLAARGIRQPLETDLRLERLRDRPALPDQDRAAQRLADAIQRGEHILIVGDFDADGATGVAVAMRGLALLGARRLSFAVPDRQKHGYGLSELLAGELVQQRPHLVVTVDHGTTSLAGIARLQAAGVEVIVTDHHLAGAERPACSALVNPNATEASHPLRHLAGVGVMFHVLAAVRAELIARGHALAAAAKLAPLLDLVALGTVADLVPLDHANRILVEHGLRRIRAGQAQPGILALLSVAGRDADSAQASDLGFVVGPRLNAAGRLDDMTHGIRCLLADDPAEARALAVELDAFNRERKDLQHLMEREAREHLAHLRKLDRDPPALLWVADPQWHPGVVGLIASRLCERWHRPVVALAPAEAGSLEWRGSGRSIPGFHLRDALVEADRRAPGLMTRFGGHAMAAGLTLQESALTPLATLLPQVAKDLMPPDALERVIWTDGSLDPRDWNLRLVDELQALGPYGQGFPEPCFEGEFERLGHRLIRERHLKLRVRAAGLRSTEVEALWFFIAPERVEPLCSAQRVRLVYQLSRERWQGQENLQLRILHAEAVA